MEEPKRNYVAEVLSACLAEGKITLQELADQIGLGRPALNALRRGEADLRLTTIIKLANYFQWTEEEVGSAVWYSDKLVESRQTKAGIAAREAAGLIVRRGKRK